MNSSTEGHIHPFQRVGCICLVCEEKSLYSRLKSTLYAETRRDIDLRPISIVWAKKVNPRVDPKLYYFWQCPACAFTADHNFFMAPFKDGTMSASRFRKIFARSRDEQDSFPTMVRLLRLDPKQETSAFISGLKLNLLAIFMWEMIEEFAKGDSLVLGSYYLRLAWLFRDVRLLAEKNPQVHESVQRLLKELATLWPAFEASEVAILRKSLRYYRQGLAKSPAIKSVPDEVSVKLIIARLEMKLGHLDEAKRAIIESRTRLNTWEQLQRASNESGPDKAVSRSKTMIASVELIYERVAEMLEKQAAEKNLRKSS